MKDTERGRQVSKRKRIRKGREQPFEYLCECGFKTHHKSVFDAHKINNQCRRGGVPQTRRIEKQKKPIWIEKSWYEKFEASYSKFASLLASSTQKINSKRTRPTVTSLRELFKNSTVFIDIHTQINELEKDLGIQHKPPDIEHMERLNTINQLSGIRCYKKIICLFIVFMNRGTPVGFYTDLVFFAVSFVTYINRLYSRSKKDPEHSDKDLFVESLPSKFQVKRFPETLSRYIKEFYEEALETDWLIKDKQGLSFFGDSDIGILRLLLFVYHFNLWLKAFRFSTFKSTQMKKELAA